MWVESFPNTADWHPLLEPTMFWGTFCRHFTRRNRGEETRISLDFRLCLEELFDKNWSGLEGVNHTHARDRIIVECDFREGLCDKR